MSAGLPMVTIVGKRNTGKSTLFNRITGSRKAIMHTAPGVTRDPLEADATWNGFDFRLIDTGGFGTAEDDPLQVEITQRMEEFVSRSSVIIFLTDVDTGPTVEEDLLLRRLRSRRERIILAVNKVESAEDAIDASEFYSLGIESVFFVSALHGQGIGELLDAVTARLPRGKKGRARETIIRVAVTGRPNVGKSSLVNALSGRQKQIVQEQPGTTRDAVETRIRFHGRQIVLVDTAGVRRRSRTDRGLESISSLISIRSVEEADIVLVLLDAATGAVSRQDTRIAAVAHKARKGTIILLNKWDLVERNPAAFAAFERRVRQAMPFISYAPLLSISAGTGTRLSKIIPLCLRVQEERTKRIATAELNALLEQARTEIPPGFHKGGTGKIFYGTQTGIAPPTFTLFVNKAAYFSRSYIRYISNSLRKTFAFEGTAIRISLRSRREV